jgi:hypothetical protein
MGVGALFAVAASAFIVSASVPDSASLTVADRLHMVALGCIFLTLLISALALRLEVTEREKLAFRIDHWSLAILPVMFYGLGSCGRSCGRTAESADALKRQRRAAPRRAGAGEASDHCGIGRRFSVLLPVFLPGHSGLNVSV